MKSKVVLWIFGLCSLGAMAENIPDQLAVWGKDGSKQVFALSKKPSVRFSPTDLIVKSQGVEINFALKDMARFTYEMSDLTGMTNLVTGKTDFKIAGDMLLFPHLDAHSKIEVYRMDGSLVFNSTIQVGGPYSFSLAHLNKGNYLVRVNGITYKIMKR